MEVVTAKEGDWVWFHDGKPKMIKGKVLEVLDFTRHGYTHAPLHYVIEVQTGIEPVHYVRDGISISDSEDRPIGFWRNFGK